MQGNILRFFRNAKNLPQKTIADVLNMSQPNYSDLENEKTKLSSEDAEKLAKYYGVDKDIFILNKNISNFEKYYKANEYLTQFSSEKIDRILYLLETEKREREIDRKKMLEVFKKINDKLNK